MRFFLPAALAANGTPEPLDHLVKIVKVSAFRQSSLPESSSVWIALTQASLNNRTGWA